MKKAISTIILLLMVFTIGFSLISCGPKNTSYAEIRSAEILSYYKSQSKLDSIQFTVENQVRENRWTDLKQQVERASIDTLYIIGTDSIHSQIYFLNTK